VLVALLILSVVAVMAILLLVTYDRLNVQSGGGSGDLSDPFQVSPGSCLIVLIYLIGLVASVIAYQGFHGG